MAAKSFSEECREEMVSRGESILPSFQREGVGNGARQEAKLEIYSKLPQRCTSLIKSFNKRKKLHGKYYCRRYIYKERNKEFVFCPNDTRSGSVATLSLQLLL